MQNAADDFLKKIQESLDNQSFIKLTLAKPTANAADLKNIYVRPILLKGKPATSFTYRYKTRDEVKNFSESTSAVSELKNCLSTQFLNADLFTTTADISLQQNTKFERKITVLKPSKNGEAAKPAEHNRAKNRYIDSKALYLNALDITTKSGEIKSDGQHKFKQINKYIETLDALIREAHLPNDAHIADFGSGKGYLTFALYDHLLQNTPMKPQIWGFELRENLVEFCNKVAQESGFQNLQFKAQDINDFQTERLDMLIALHACDIATDIAIAKGIAAQAAVIVVAPCCHKQIRNELRKTPNPRHALAPILKNGILEERQAEMLTDGIRALILEAKGYKTKVFEFISTEHTPKNVMITAVKTQPRPEAWAEIAELKRLFNIETHYLETLL
jgi:hypothetical protein